MMIKSNRSGELHKLVKRAIVGCIATSIAILLYRIAYPFLQPAPHFWKQLGVVSNVETGQAIAGSGVYVSNNSLALISLPIAQSHTVYVWHGPNDIQVRPSGYFVFLPGWVYSTVESPKGVSMDGSNDKIDMANAHIKETPAGLEFTTISGIRVEAKVAF